MKDLEDCLQSKLLFFLLSFSIDPAGGWLVICYVIYKYHYPSESIFDHLV